MFYFMKFVTTNKKKVTVSDHMYNVKGHTSPLHLMSDLELTMLPKMPVEKLKQLCETQVRWENRTKSLFLSHQWSQPSYLCAKLSTFGSFGSKIDLRGLVWATSELLVWAWLIGPGSHPAITCHIPDWPWSTVIFKEFDLTWSDHICDTCVMRPVVVKSFDQIV